MVEYDPSRDKIIVDGRVISPGHARQIKSGIEDALETREAYQSSSLLDDVATNDRAVELVCGAEDGDPEIPVLVEFALDGRGDGVDAVPDEHVDAWVDQYDTHGSFITSEDTVVDVFHDTEAVFSGFHVEFADHEVRDEHL